MARRSRRVDIQDAEKMERCNQEAEREFQRVLHRLERVHLSMEDMGQNDMGHISLQLARKFHKATALVTEILEALYEQQKPRK